MYNPPFISIKDKEKAFKLCKRIMTDKFVKAEGNVLSDSKTFTFGGTLKSPTIENFFLRRMTGGYALVHIPEDIPNLTEVAYFADELLEEERKILTVNILDELVKSDPMAVQLHKAIEDMDKVLG